MKEINNFLGRRLFRVTEGTPFLRYPTINSERAYQQAHAELFKVLGSDSLDRDVLKSLYKKLFNKGITLNGSFLKKWATKIFNLKNEEAGPWAYFKKLSSEIPGINFDGFNRCHKARNELSHEAEHPALPTQDLRQKFIDDTVSLLENLVKIKLYLEEKEVSLNN